MKKHPFSAELHELTQYIKSERSEKAKQAQLYPIFKKLFKDKFRIESDAHEADVYIEGQLLVETKSSYSQWLAGFYQALHYQRRFGLAYNTVVVIAHQFVGVWKVNQLPEFAATLANTTDPNLAPNKAGTQNARKTNKANREAILGQAFYRILPKEIEKGPFKGGKSLTVESFELLKILQNLDSDRLQINPQNFIAAIAQMQRFFAQPIDAVHAFYTIVAYWDITATVSQNEYSEEVRVIGFKGQKFSEAIFPLPEKRADFKRFIERQYVFTNQGSGLTADYYFSRFDEVLQELDPEYVKQHGIFFTDNNLSKLALRFVRDRFSAELDERYIVLDPAGGSGNLVSSWKGRLKHKVVSELQPDLLRTIERRMKADPYHIETGFTVIPRVSQNEGLNFLNQSAADYLRRIEEGLQNENLSLNRPVAFLLNPPYKNTDENQKSRQSTEAEYDIHPSILELTGQDAGKERYLAFLGQILRLTEELVARTPELSPAVMIFTPTSWLIPRPTYTAFRDIWDRHFAYVDGFITTSREFFKLKGKWPLAFTIWQYQPAPEGNANEIWLSDLTALQREDIEFNWTAENPEDEATVQRIFEKAKRVNFSAQRVDIREWANQSMYDFKRSPTKSELKSGEVYGGLPLKDERRKNKKTYGTTDSEYLGFMDNGTPVRVKLKEGDPRFEGREPKVWFRLDAPFKDTNRSKCFNGPPDNRGYCAYDLPSAKATFSWFCITKALNGRYPIWANQFDIWQPEIPPAWETTWYALCFAYLLAENRCVVTTFPADDPVSGAPEVQVENPLSPINPEAFWQTTLRPACEDVPRNVSTDLVDAVTELYHYWAREYCPTGRIEHVGLHEEAYFRYFDYPDYLTKHSGLVQIRKYAELEGAADLLERFKTISAHSKAVREELYRLLTEEFGYFG